MSDGTETTPRGSLRPQWQPGQSGNPRGRPPGRRDHRLIALDAVGADAASNTVESVIKCALGGDMVAASIILRRCWPERKGRPIVLDLPAITGPADLLVASATVIAMMASGEISAEEAQIASAVLATHRGMIETEELADRIAALERASGA